LGQIFEAQGDVEKAIRTVEEGRAIFVAIKAAVQIDECDETLARLRGVGGEEGS